MAFVITSMIRCRDLHISFLTLQRCSMSRRVASLTLAHSHSQPLTTMVMAWKFFCLGLGMICTLYWSMMARMYGLLVSGAD